LIFILTKTQNAILKQYEKLFAMESVHLEFTEGAIDAIVQQALELKTGARALRSIIERFMLDVFFVVSKDKAIRSVTITEEVVQKGAHPLMQ